MGRVDTACSPANLDSLSDGAMWRLKPLESDYFVLYIDSSMQVPHHDNRELAGFADLATVVLVVVR
jgi:hypothetical protein